MHRLHTKLMIVAVSTLLVSTMAAVGVGYLVWLHFRPDKIDIDTPAQEPAPSEPAQKEPAQKEPLWELEHNIGCYVLVKDDIPIAIFDKRGAMVWLSPESKYEDEKGLGWATRRIYLDRQDE